MAFDAKRFEAAWERYVAAIEKSNSAFRSYLGGGGASEADIRAAEAATDAKFSAGLRYLLSRVVGSNSYFALPCRRGMTVSPMARSGQRMVATRLDPVLQGRRWQSPLCRSRPGRRWGGRAGDRRAARHGRSRPD